MAPKAAKPVVVVGRWEKGEGSGIIETWNAKTKVYTKTWPRSYTQGAVLWSCSIKVTKSSVKESWKMTPKEPKKSKKSKESKKSKKSKTSKKSPKKTPKK